MKILKISSKLKRVKIRIENNDDLFYLKNFIEPGDFVKAMTPRSLFLEREGEMKKIGKKMMLIKILVEKVEFQLGIFQLRISGRIVEAPENVQLDSFHTIEAKPGKYMTITKNEWREYQIQRLKEAEKKTPNILIVAVDLDQATLALLKNNRIDVLTEVKNTFSLQHEEKRIPEYYSKVAEEILNFSPQMKNIIIAGPGFAKEHVAKIIREKNQNEYSKISIGSVSSSTITGINEAVKLGLLDKLAENQLTKESKLVEDFFLHLRKDDGLAVLGDDVFTAKDMNAIQTLLISEEKMKEKKIEELAKSLENKVSIQIISTLHDLGQQFNNIGGLGAILRFKIKWSG
ncbi:MAG: mRNA surveillance protein pelota [Candidatus Aenigmatarchaeota archaeon]|nr:mRNA surveillance protein pelota [Candidatus Aenigmarchaeota archaeon]